MAIKNHVLKLHEHYTRAELINLDLKPFKKDETITGSIFLGEDHVYFFSETANNRLELYSVINRNSFYLQ